MDLTSIEPMSVAIRTGQVAAAELCNLLTHEDDDVPTPIEDWFDPRAKPVRQGDGRRQQLDALASKVEKLGSYVCHSADAVSGERLYRWGVHENVVSRGEWADQPFARRQCFEQFAAIVRAAYLPLKLEQERIKTEGALPPQQLGLALEDTIFAPTEKLSTLTKEATAAAAGIAAYHQAIAEEAERKRREPPPNLGPTPETLSAGEAPHTPPKPNRGGRGKRKSG